MCPPRDLHILFTAVLFRILILDFLSYLQGIPLRLFIAFCSCVASYNIGYGLFWMLVEHIMPGEAAAIPTFFRGQYQQM